MTLAEYIAQERAKEPEYSKALELDAEIGVIQERMKQDMIDFAAKVKELKTLCADREIKVCFGSYNRVHTAIVPFVADTRINNNVGCFKYLNTDPEMYSRTDFNEWQVVV